jgi:hypothetical protein
MTDGKKTRQTPTKEDRRLIMENATRVAAEDASKQKALRDAKSARLRAQRLGREASEGTR